MKMFDKIKDLFTDEVEVDEEPVKKEVIQVEIPAPLKEEKEEVKVESKEEAKSPFFDDVDFDDIKRSNPTLEEVENRYYEDRYREEKRREEHHEIYPAKKEEKKHFEPTPIISPVYGVLDKNYKKDDIVNKAEPPKENKTITLDDVRNKAYGTLEDELESTLFGRTAILFQNNKKDELEEIEKDLKETADAIDMITEEVEAPKHEKKEKKTDQVSEDMSENDLFNLIDDMYGKGDN